ncbi:MAG TPA: phenylalanine 4-monooxygenase [Bosea sp. (in: a-proteobacteria)]|jgi:phenylalanine-4-hydroxylase|uniref:phenylalanine 4-monooxygenase n=1 Tax=Bosea sp. (in: a-proteobacteria) TaxID=1871050 RepID=UPI002E136029|nr:phenylalanine 4-monooxygenase [Bosea sp. (in: a-proteobacteria)]
MTTDPLSRSGLKPDDVPADFVVDQRFQHYTAADHDTWSRLHRRQFELLRGRVCDEFFAGLSALGIAADGIPDFRQINRVLKAATGWEVVAVPGLVPDRVFFSHLAQRRFPAGFWIRRPEEFDYIEEPDVFHDVFGHVPLLMNRSYADFVAAYGAAGLRYADPEDLARLARLYWYSVEFGLIETGAGLRIFGAGIASSPGETVFSLESAEPNRIRLDPVRVMRTRYKIDDFQQTYFVLPSFEAMPDLAAGPLEAAMAQARALPELEADARIAEDRSVAVGAAAHRPAA